MEIIEKIILGRDVLLTEVIDKISSSKSGKILLYVEEGNDIGTSLVTLKLILEKAKEYQKSLIIITSDSTTHTLAQKVGIISRNSDKEIIDKDWMDPAVTGSVTSSNDSLKTDKTDEVGDADIFEKVKDEEKVATGTDADTVKPAIRSVDGFSMVVGGDVESVKNNSTVLASNSVSTLSRDTKLDKRKNDLGFVGKDWSNRGSVSLPDEHLETKSKSSDVYVRKGGIKEIFTDNNKFKKILKMKYLWIGLGVGLFLGVMWFLYYYNFVPSVQVILYPENIPVSYEGNIIAEDSAIGISVSDGVVKISSKRGERTINSSASGNTEEKTEIGEYATGSVTLYNATDEDIVLERGKIVKGGGRDFELSDTVTVPAQTEVITETSSQINKGTKIASVRATEIGPEYNVSSGAVFTVNGYDSSSLYGQNFATFTGGSKSEVYIVTEKDVLRIGNELEGELEKQLKQQLRDLYPQDKWALVEEKIKIEKGEGVERFSTDVPIGSEATIINVTVELTATGIYYNIDELEAATKELLILDFNNRTSEDEQSIVNATLDNNYQVTINNVSVDDDNIVISISANGIMRTSIDIIKIEQELKGKKWDEGNEYLKNLPNMRSDPEVIFEPENYIERFKHFPNNTQKIRVRIKNEYVSNDT